MGPVRRRWRDAGGLPSRPPPESAGLHHRAEHRDRRRSDHTSIKVAAQDSQGAVIANFSGTITLTVGANPGSGHLSGTTSQPATSGVATFADLSIDRVGQGYTLIAAATGMQGGT